MGYPGDDGGGPPDSRLDARTRRAALSIPPRGPAAPGEEEPGGAAAEAGPPPRARPGRPRTARPRQAMEADPGTAGRPAIQADPAAVTGARTAPLPIRARPQARLRPDTRRPPLVARATRQPTKGRAARRLPRARATRQQPRGRAARPLRPGRATRQLPGRPARGARPGGGDVNTPRAGSPAAAPLSPRRPRPRPAVHRQGRTRGGVRNGGPARRSRERRGTVPAAGDRSLAGHCGAPVPSGPRAPADAAHCVDSRPRPERPTRCTRRASSRRGTRLSSARSVRPGAPA